MSADLLPSDLVWMFAWPCAEPVQDINLIESQDFFGSVILSLFGEMNWHTEVFCKSQTDIKDMV